MSKADKMFEELGYFVKKEKNICNNKCISYINGFLEKIEFDIVNKGITCETLSTGMSLPINLQELQAINEKVKELGWNE